MAEAALELLEPAHEALDARGRRVVDHRAAPYQTMTEKYNVLNSDHARNTNESDGSDKVELERVSKNSLTALLY